MAERNGFSSKSKNDKFSYCKLRMALPPRENLTRKYDWDDEQYRMMVKIASSRYYEKKYGLVSYPNPEWKPRTEPRWYPKPVKGVDGNTVYYVLRVGEYTPLLAFLYDTIDLKEESISENKGYLQIQCVFAENAELRPSDLVYVHDGPMLSRNTLDWILRRIDRLEEETGGAYKCETRISNILSKENSKYNDGYWIEAFYDSDGNLGRAPWD